MKSKGIVRQNYLAILPAEAVSSEGGGTGEGMASFAYEYLFHTSKGSLICRKS
jgi:hypothetical protein